jgi:hypothetical protein
MNFDDTPIYSLEQLKPILVAIKTGKLTSNVELIHSMDIVLFIKSCFSTEMQKNCFKQNLSNLNLTNLTIPNRT